MHHQAAALHLAELLQADLRAMQTRAEWTVRTNQPDPDGMCTKSGLDKRFPLFGDKTLLMIACGAGDATCVEMLLTGVTGRFMDPEGDNDGSFTMKSITMRSGIDEVVSAGRWITSYDGWSLCSSWLRSRRWHVASAAAAALALAARVQGAMHGFGAVGSSKRASERAITRS